MNSWYVLINYLQQDTFEKPKIIKYTVLIFNRLKHTKLPDPLKKMQLHNFKNNREKRTYRARQGGCLLSCTIILLNGLKFR